MKNKPKFSANNELVLLTIATDYIQVSAICDLLKQAEIPTVKKHRGSASYINIFMGGRNVATEIYVPESAHEKALDLVGFLIDDTDNKEKTPLDNDDIADVKKWNKKQFFRGLILLTLFALPIIIMLATAAVMILNSG